MARPASKCLKRITKAPGPLHSKGAPDPLASNGGRIRGAKPGEECDRARASGRGRSVREHLAAPALPLRLEKK